MKQPPVDMYFHYILKLKLFKNVSNLSLFPSYSTVGARTRVQCSFFKVHVHWTLTAPDINGILIIITTDKDGCVKLHVVIAMNYKEVAFEKAILVLIFSS